MTDILLSGYPLKPIDAISDLVERNTAAIPRLKADLRKRPLAERELANGFVERCLEIQHLYLARVLALRTTVEFLLECRPQRSQDGWSGTAADGESLDPPKEVTFCLDEIQAHLDRSNRGVPA